MSKASSIDPIVSADRAALEQVLMFDFDALSNAMVRQTVLCVGDLMLDEFVYGEVSRISPEAPAPVIAVQRSETNIGGSGNVARNIASLGARCIFVGLIGEDDAGKTLKAALAKESLIESVLISDPARPTTRKVRFVSEHFSTHMLRADWEKASPAAADIEQKLIDAILPLLSRADIVLLSDYAKGVLTARVIRNVIDAARKLDKRVIVDPKSANLAIYRGATLLTPNRKEFAEATRSRAGTEAEIAVAAQEAMLLADCEAMLVTLSEHGMILVPRCGEAIHVPGYPVKVRDVSGAGDTAAAVAAVALAAGADWETALRIANAAAAVAVGKKGTAVVTLAELRRKILPHAFLAAEEKIVAAGDLDAHLEDWCKQGLRIGFTNGCFDILHPGHVKVLTAARGACDRLIVGLNSDASVRRLKGEGRPVQDERARAEVLAALEAIDLVVIFEQDTPIELITRIKPSVLVKGGDYTRDQVVGHEVVEAGGGEILLVDILQGFSTTSLVQRAREGKA
jgi:D-beta-D-heptose 7-phosphate kinase/D-beta-D-heptose 1-phosphate adenosyltransferase